MSPWANNLLRRRAPAVRGTARRKKLPRSKTSRISADAPDDIFGHRKGRSLVRIRPPQAERDEHFVRDDGFAL